MKRRGFSLIELLIVVAIILVIAAIAIPNMLRAKMHAREAAAVSAIRTINTAQVTYAATFPSIGYADNLAKLGGAPGSSPDPAHSGLVDWLLGCASQPCSRTGYSFVIVNAQGSPVRTSYDVYGTPDAPGISGIRGFCSNGMNPVTADLSGGTNCTVPVQ